MNMLTKRSWDDELRHNVGRQIADLRHQVEALAKSVERSGGHLQHEAGDLGEAIWHTGSEFAHQIERQSQRAVRAIEKDPVPAIVTAAAIIAAGAMLMLLLSRR
jgi:hypothetical protein